MEVELVLLTQLSKVQILLPVKFLLPIQNIFLLGLVVLKFRVSSLGERMQI